MSLREQIKNQTDNLVSAWETRNSYQENSSGWNSAEDKCYEIIQALNQLYSQDNQTPLTKADLRSLYTNRVGQVKGHW